VTEAIKIVIEIEIETGTETENAPRIGIVPRIAIRNHGLPLLPLITIP